MPRLAALCVTLATLLAAMSCSSIDCPLNTSVRVQYQLMNAAGEVDTLKDTLTISTTRTDDTDSVLINKKVGATGFSLPLSYSRETDEFYVDVKDTQLKVSTLDTIYVTKENVPHFESVDCAPSFFHRITSVSHTGNAIDSIVINHPEVNYDATRKHLLIYFRHRD